MNVRRGEKKRYQEGYGTSLTFRAVEDVLERKIREPAENSGSLSIRQGGGKIHEIRRKADVWLDRLMAACDMPGKMIKTETRSSKAMLEELAKYVVAEPWPF